MRKLASFLVLCSSSAFADVPPAPLAPNVGQAAMIAAKALQSNDVSAYEGLLAPNLEVWLDGKLIATSRDAWMKRFGAKLGTAGVRYNVERAFAGGLNFVLIYHFDSRGSFPLGKQDCCQRYEVAKYEMVDGKVRTLSILSTGNSIVAIPEPAQN